MQTLFGSLYVSPVHQVQPPVPGDPAGRARLPHQARRPENIYVRSRERQHGAAEGRGHDALRDRRRHRDALQQLPRRQDDRRCRRRATARARRSPRWRKRPREVLPSDFGYRLVAARPSRRRRRAARRRWCSSSALIMVFLILAAQYEKWSLPFGVLLAVPFALFGALLAILLRGLEQRHLLPDRPDDAGRAGGEERDPDLRVRGLNRDSEGSRSTTPPSTRRATGCARSS